MPKKCKDCDPNKYIEGLAFRGANGWSYDGATTYNDVGKPGETTQLADISDIHEVFNPVLVGPNGVVINDVLGLPCYTPVNEGPASSSRKEDLTLNATSLIKSSFSNNPAENVPTITFSPFNIEHQVFFISGPLGVQVSDSYSIVTVNKNNTSTQYFPGVTYTNILENSSNFANQKVRGFPKYPNGIPASNGTFQFYVKPVHECSFPYTTQLLTLYIGTYSPRAGDVYSCTYTATCFTKKTKINTPKGKISIAELKIGDEVLAFDENQNIKISTITSINDHDKEPQPIYKVKLENGTVIESTLSHPFLDKNNEFKFLNEFKEGDSFISFDKKEIKILEIKQSHFEEVYNFEVEKYHTYIAEDIFCHNIGGGGYRGYVRKQSYNYNANTALTSSSIPGNCHSLVSRIGENQSISNYAYWFTYSLRNSKDVGITSLTNISVLDVLSEGPIEGIVDYEIAPKPGYVKGDIGYRNGVNIKPYLGSKSYLRSIYWNETAIADNTYPAKGSLNFEFIKFAFDNGSVPYKHLNLDDLKHTNLEEEFYTKKIPGGKYIPFVRLYDATNNRVLIDQAKLPKRLTSTKTVGSRLFGKRKFVDGSEKTYKKSINILTKDLYGLKLHIKGVSMFKSIIDLTIWDTADQAAQNSVGGRIDRQMMTFNLFLKRIDKSATNQGVEIIPIKNPYSQASPVALFDIGAEQYYNTVFSVEKDVLALFWPPNCAGCGAGQEGPDGYQRQPANYTEFINGRTTYSHRHDGKIYTSYARDVNKLQRDFEAARQAYIAERRGFQSNSTSEYAVVYMVGKLSAGSFIETFEWTGLDKITNNNTIGWEIEIEPTYEESVDPNIVIKAGIDSVTEVYKDSISPSNTAGIITTFDARFFTSIPQRAYDTRLLRIKVPTNYNPYSKIYTGAWNGTFKLAWTDNPAWCFYDMITNRRYGLGKYVDPYLTDKWTLYEISKYCDELVSDGRGSLEPRFTCNMLLSTREDAYKVINDMASIFRAIVYYNAGLIFATQDRPKDPIYIFNNSNVKDGDFTYSSSSKRVRRNVVLVRYNNKDNFYKPAVKYSENREGILRFGIKELEVSAFGCTSEGQAERLAKWTLLSENMESELISFETSLPAMYLKPGDVVLVQDQNRQNKILGGRTYALKENYAILDIKYSDISGYLPIISGCNFNVLTPAGNIEIGTETGNIMFNSIPASGFLVKNVGTVSEINSSLIRRKQVQTVTFNNTFASGVSMEQSGNFDGYTRLTFGTGTYLDRSEHTLLDNTAWTIELNPNQYNFTKSPSVTGLSNLSKSYPGAYLEPHIDKTQKFRVLDIEEVEEFRYKITALQYEIDKFNLAEDI